MPGNSKTETAYIALGSNLGDRAGYIRLALSHLQTLSAKHLVSSSLWESEAIDCPEGSGKFLNAVVQMETSLEPHTLLAKLQEIEAGLGRPEQQQRVKNAPRTMDLDIICYGNLIINNRDLVIPHPRAKDRLFVLEPLAEIAPGLCMPGFKDSISVLLTKVRSGKVRRMS
jgi:2-amino-4-hydroxy-6-hydroxymethyldihydropteridine diphosphokinase